MKEITRIFANRRLLAGLLLIILVNGFLFATEQIKGGYGLDLSQPASDFLIFESDGQMISGGIESSGAEYYRTYQKWLLQYRNIPLPEAQKRLEQEKTKLNHVAELANLLETDGGPYGQNMLKEYRENSPELTLQLEKGEIDLTQVRLDYVAVNNLLKQVAYLDGYGGYLTTIQENKKSMLSFSIFNDLNTFTGRNILKTAAEFEKLQGIPLALGTDGAVKAFLSFPLTDYLLLGVLALICLAFLEERKKGLWSIVHSASYGRLRLGLRRASVLLIAAASGVLFLYGTNFLLAFCLYGGWNELSRAAQSLEILGKLPVLYTVETFLIRYLLLRIASAFLVGLFLWLLLSAITNVKYTLVVLAVFLTAEYMLYAFLPVQSVFNLFKYFNIFTYIHLTELYIHYLNINLAGFPLGIRVVSQAAMLPLIIITAAGCLLIQCRKKPAAGKDLLGHIAYCVNSVTDLILRRLHLFGAELHKTLSIQKGIVIIVLFVYVALGLSYTEVIPVYNPSELFAKQYTTSLEGVVDDTMFEKMENIQTDLDDVISAYQEAARQYEQGKMDYPQFDVHSREGATAQLKREALTIVRKRAESLQEQGRQKGIDPWLIDETPYESVYGMAAQDNRRAAALVSLLTLSLLLAGCMTYENQSGMTFLLASAPRGRKAVLCRKFGIAVLLTTMVWSITNGLELYAFFSKYASHTLQAPVQNLSMLRNCSLHCSIAAFMILLYLLRLMMMLGCALIILGISGEAKRLEQAYIAAAAVTMLPSLLYFYIGIAPMKYLSLAGCITVMDLLLPGSGNLRPIHSAVTAVGLVCLFVLLRLTQRFRWKHCDLPFLCRFSSNSTRI